MEDCDNIILALMQWKCFIN